MRQLCDEVEQKSSVGSDGVKAFPGVLHREVLRIEASATHVVRQPFSFFFRLTHYDVDVVSQNGQFLLAKVDEVHQLGISRWEAEEKRCFGN